VMRLRLVSAILTLILIGSAAGAQSSGPVTSDKGSDGTFTAIALITDDLAWHEKFRQPQTPQIDGRGHFAPGQRGALALIFSNAEPRQGKVKIACDVTAFDPAGSRVLVKAGPCYDGPFAGPNLLHPTGLDLHFTIAPDDPQGLAGFRVTLRDLHSGRAVDLEVSFTQGVRR